MNRWLALLLAIVGGALAAYFVVLFAFGALAGILWLYVFGDDPWPELAMTILNLAIPVVGLALWGWFAWAIWSRLRSPA